MIRLHSGSYMNTGQLKVMIRTIQDVMWDFSIQGLVASYVAVHCSCPFRMNCVDGGCGPGHRVGGEEVWM
jgi:hypothetical protein